MTRASGEKENVGRDSEENSRSVCCDGHNAGKMLKSTVVLCDTKRNCISFRKVRNQD